MINVDIVSPIGGCAGGIENVIYRWTKYIDKSKIHLRFLALGKPERLYVDEDFKEAYFVNNEQENKDLNYLIEAYSQLIQRLGAPDICIAAIWPTMVEACVHVRNELKLNMKVVSWIHNDISEFSDEKGTGTILNVLKADAHFCLHKGKADEILAINQNAKTYIIGNPIEITTKNNSTSDVSVQKNNLTFIGRLDYLKGIDVILEAMYKSKYDWNIKIIGEGTIHDEVVKWIDILKLNDKVELLGWKDNPFDYCKDSEILVMASRTEGFPLTAYEAWARGMMVIGTPVGSLKEDIADGVNGYSFNAGDTDELVGILDGIACGKLRICDSKKCEETADAYLIKNYFMKIIRSLYEIFLYCT